MCDKSSCFFLDRVQKKIIMFTLFVDLHLKMCQRLGELFQ